MLDDEIFKRGLGNLTTATSTCKRKSFDLENVLDDEILYAFFSLTMATSIGQPIRANVREVL